MLWLARLHDELPVDRPGRFWNGIGSAIFTVTALTGLVVWWPGSSRWKRSGDQMEPGWRRFNWDLHSAVGFWLFLFMLMWGSQLLSRRLGAVLELRGLDFRSRGDSGRSAGRHRVELADASSFRAMAQRPGAQGAVGDHRPGAADDARDRRDHVVEPRAAEAAERERSNEVSA